MEKEVGGCCSLSLFTRELKGLLYHPETIASSDDSGAAAQPKEESHEWERSSRYSSSSDSYRAASNTCEISPTGN